MKSFMQPMPFVFPMAEPTNPEGTVVYFHPGGLPSQSISHMTAHLKNWRIYVVELMLCAEFIEAIDKEGQLQTNIASIAKTIQMQLTLSTGKNTLFIGWSFGGVMAYEVASQLTPELQPKLVLLDSIAPVTTYSFDEQNVTSIKVVRWFVQYLQSLKGVKLQERFSWRYQKNIDAILTDLLKQAKSYGAFDQNTKLAGFRKVFNTFTQGLMRNTSLAANYKATTYQQPVLLIRASNGLLKRFRWVRHMGWNPLIDNLSIKSVKADHYQMISENNALKSINVLIKEFQQLEVVNKPTSERV